jgi:hypothetical protein
MVTIDIDEGVTPMMIACDHKAEFENGKCNEVSRSAFYQCDPTLTPEYEWFKPTSMKGYSQAMREHFANGGLEIRKIKS